MGAGRKGAVEGTTKQAEGCSMLTANAPSHAVRQRETLPLPSSSGPGGGWGVNILNVYPLPL